MAEIRPTGQALHLVSALTNAQNYDLHLKAIEARDIALSSSTESYNNLCLQLAYILVGADQPHLLQIDPSELDKWRHDDPQTVQELQQNSQRWIPFGQMSGLILKSALLYPQFLNQQALCLQPPVSDQVKQVLLQALHCTNPELRAVASSIIATTSVSLDGVQPYLHILNWPDLIPSILQNLNHDVNSMVPVVDGSLDTVRKMLEDGSTQIDVDSYDRIIPAMLPYLGSQHERYKILSLQCLATAVAEDAMPGTLALHFDSYLHGLSNLSRDPVPEVRMWVCRSITTILQLRPEYLRDHLKAVAPFMLTSTAGKQFEMVAKEACEFWLAFALLDEGTYSSEMFDVVRQLLPQLIPVLVENMVYSNEQRAELIAQNQMDLQQTDTNSMAPIFHRSSARPAGPSKMNRGEKPSDDDDSEIEESDDEDEFDDMDGNEWTLRKCSAASLDSLASMFGGEAILPPLLPILQQGFASNDQWIQEATILALGAIAEGCTEEIEPHLHQLHPYLMSILARPETPENIPQIKCIAAWTISRYTSWAIEQVQTGVQGDLLARMTEVFLTLLEHKNRRVQIACCSAFSLLVEFSGDLMTPYLDPVYRSLVGALSRYSGKSLLLIFDVIGGLADNCGSSVGENNLPAIYMPPIMRKWNELAQQSPSNRAILPLVESIASVAMVAGHNIDVYALECFENAMRTIEMVQLELQALNITDKNEEEVDPIICATDLIDGLVEGFEKDFQALVARSQMYGQHFLSVVKVLCNHDVSGVRMSAFALVGDLAKNCPKMLGDSMGAFVPDLLTNIDPVQRLVCTNAVWALGEILVQCQGKKELVEPMTHEALDRLIPLLEGNGLLEHDGPGVAHPGLSENAASCLGRLAKVDTQRVVATELPRFLVGWCDAMAKVSDPVERHDAFEGFLHSLYANPQAIQNTFRGLPTAVASILFAIMSWHLPSKPAEELVHLMMMGELRLEPFPTSEAALGNSLFQLVQDMKSSVGEDAWHRAIKEVPVNQRQMLRQIYPL